MLSPRGAANLPVIGPLIGYAGYAARNRPALGAVFADWRRTARAAAFARDIGPGRPNGRNLLILALGDESVYQAKLYCMLAIELRRRGWRPIVIQDLRARAVARRYYSAFGIREVAYLEDFGPGEAERAACRAALDAFARSAWSVQSIKAWSFEGAWIGPQVLSTLSRRGFVGAPDPSHPEVRRDILAALPHVLQHVVRCRHAVAALRPDLAFTVEANYATFGPMVDACVTSDVPVIQITQPWKDDALMLKRLTRETRRHHPSSVSPQTFARLSQQPWTAGRERALADEFAARYGGKWFLQARNQPDVRRRSRAEIVAELGLDPGRKLAVVFSHILWDANLFYGEDLFEDYADWYVQTVKAACANDRVNWLIKMHPANLWKRAWERVETEYAETALVRDRIGPLPAHVRLVPPDSKISTLSLFEAADYGVTVRGTAGMELACFGVPVLTAGTGRYSGLGFTEDSSTTREYLDRLARIETLPRLDARRTELAKLHAYAVFRLRHWPMRSFRGEFAYPARGAHPLAQNLVPTVASLQEIDRNGDLRAFADWAERFDAVDYLEPEP